MNSQSMSTQELAVSLAAMAAQTRCRDVVVLDMRGRSPVTEFFVLATGTSDRQMRTVGDELADHGAQCGFKLFRRSGDESAHWIVLDFVGVVAHIFNESSRAFYDLEALWDGCPRINWQILAESNNPAAASIDARPTAAPMSAAGVGATTDTTVSTAPAVHDQPTATPQTADIAQAEIIEETEIELVGQVVAVPGPTAMPEDSQPRPKRKAAVAKPSGKRGVKNKPRPTKPSLTRATDKAKAKAPPAKPTTRKNRVAAKTVRTPAKSRAKAVSARRPATAPARGTAKRRTAAKAKPNVRRKAR